MSIVPLNIGSGPNDGTGQDLRSGGQVINANFSELDQRTNAAQSAADGARAKADTAQAKADAAIPGSQKGQPNGVAELDATGTVPAIQLPSYVDDVLEFASFAALPVTGETGKIYITIDTNSQYRWSGSQYILLTASPGSTDAVPEGSVNKYWTNARTLASLLTGFTLPTVAAAQVTSADSVLTALAKLQWAITGWMAPTIANLSAPTQSGASWTTSGTTNPIAGFPAGSQSYVIPAGTAADFTQLLFARTNPVRVGVRRSTAGALSQFTELAAYPTGTTVMDAANLPVMTGATASAAGKSGLVPVAAAGDQAKFLTGGGTYSEVPAMVGATASVAGKAGLVPAPTAGDLRFLATDGNWYPVSSQKLPVSIKAFGDSNTVGYGLASTSFNYINREAEIVKIPFVNNAVNSACTWDQAVQVYNTNLAVNEASQIMIGTNDSRRYGTVANDLDTFKRCHASLVAWLAIPELGKVRATNALITYTGNWGDSAAYPGLTLKGSPAIGTVASFTFTGTTLYFSTARTNTTGTRASATVRIDGVVVGTVTTQGFSSNTINGAYYGPALYRFGGLSAGQHTVTITTVTADAQNLFFVEWFAVPDPANFSRPVNVLNVARQTAAGGGVDATTTAYNTAISDNVAMLVADGYRINLADVFSTINPATDLQADGLHFNLQGHTKVAGVASPALLKF